MPKYAVVTQVHEDHTVTVSCIDELGTELRLPISQVSNDANDESGFYSLPSENSIAIVEGNPTSGYYITGFVSPVDENGGLAGTTEKIVSGDKWIKGPSGVGVGILKGGIIKLFVTNLCQLFISKLKNTFSFYLENLRILFPNISMNVSTDVNVSEAKVEFKKAGVTVHELFADEKKIDISITGTTGTTADITVDTSPTATSVLTININNKGSVKMDSLGNVVIDGTTIKIGGATATQPAILGWKLISWLLNHTHPSNGSPPASTPPTSALSSKVFIGE